jgi:hypothetical protein
MQRKGTTLHCYGVSRCDSGVISMLPMAAEPAMLKRVLIPSPIILPAPLTTVAPTLSLHRSKVVKQRPK